MSGPDTGKVLKLDPTSPPHAVLGQASSCAIQLSDPHVSRRHFALTATPTHALLVDLGSMNGTRVNGVLVREARLYGGETIAIGRTLIGVESDQATAANVPGTLPPPSAAEPQDYINSVIGDRLAFTAARQRVIAEFERRYVEELLVRHNGNVTHAARASGVAHRYFQLVRARSR
jgi:pSer/pThr/pTyr-binding forkhead associated (FHA) protein